MRLCPDDTIHCRGPKGSLPPELVQAMRQHKGALLSIVEAFEERAAIYEFEAGLGREDAERQAVMDLPEE
jgi:hypothetical protein